MKIISKKKIKFAKTYLAEQKKLKEKFNLEQKQSILEHKESKNVFWKKQN